MFGENLAGQGAAAAWLALLAVASLIALAASGLPDKRRLWGWLSDYFVRWGMSGLFLWFIMFAFWAFREILAQSYVAAVWPIEGFIENSTLWGVTATGFLTLAFFGGTLMLQAIFSRVEAPHEGVVYYKQEVLVTPDGVAGRAFKAELPAVEEPVKKEEKREEAPKVIIE
jgi:hypothetical protein